MHKGIWLLGLGVFLMMFGCGSDPTKPDDKDPPAVWDIFHEPPSFCSRFQAGTDTLALYNLGDSTAVLTLTSPDWVQGLPSSVTLDPVSLVELGWFWSQETPPVEGEITVASGDTSVVIPVRLLSSIAEDTNPLDAPRIVVPEDGETFIVEQAFTVCWSRLVDCDGVSFRIEVSKDPSFTSLSFWSKIQRESCIGLVPEIEDLGLAYYRIRAQTDRTPPEVAYSETRTWVVIEP